MAEAVKITEQSKTLFVAYVEDSPNWAGSPMVGGNVGAEEKDKGNLTQLKKAGLLETCPDGDRPDIMWITFLRRGIDYAKELGIVEADDLTYVD